MIIAMIIAMDIIDIGIGFVFTMMILAIVMWNIFQHTAPKPRVAICVKCKYCIKIRKWPNIKKISCRTPEDGIEINFVTGTIYKPTFNCKLRNSHGTCPDYKKVWWQR